VSIILHHALMSDKYLPLFIIYISLCLHSGLQHYTESVLYSWWTYFCM